MDTALLKGLNVFEYAERAEDGVTVTDLARLNLARSVAYRTARSTSPAR